VTNSRAHGLQPFFDVPIEEQISLHLALCNQCQNAIENDRPRGLGQRSSHCDTYWHLLIMRAYAEGKANNIVAHTELGDEAPKGRPLE